MRIRTGVWKMINDLLYYKGRCLRTRAGKLLMGPTGKRLFVDYLDKVPGFCGRIDFIHKVNLTSLFRIRCSAQDNFETAETVWYPSMLTMNFENGRIRFFEIKFITYDDCAVSCQSWTNKMGVPMKISLEVQAEMCETSVDSKTGCILLKSPKTQHGYSIGVSVKTDIGLEKGPINLMPGESISFTAVAAVGNLETESFESIIQRSVSFFQQGVNYVERHNREYQDFFENAPQFRSSDEVLNKVWWYRWFILRHCLAEPNFGYLQGAVMYEGRSHKTTKDPFNSKGWEFSKLINLSTPLHITDMRWHSNRQLVYQMIYNMLNNVDENGIFCSAYVDRRLHAYANYGIWAIYQLWQVDGNSDFIREILPKLKDYVSNEARIYGNESDHLQIEVKHNRTGKEYQPSYWYFHNYPQNPKDPSGYTPLKRVDRSIYHYKNVLGLAKLCKAVGDGDYALYERMAEDIKNDVLSKMWDEETGFFYDLHYETDQKAMVKNIVGIYPYWADITEARHLKGLELLFDEKYFNTPCPFPSVARDCKAYRPEGGWMGNFIKGRDGCVWCGPSWPYTTGIALDAIAIQSKKYGHRYDKQFAHFLREYSLQHFRDRDIAKPYLVEHYNAETGEPLSDEADYNHSFYIDLIISHVAGVNITEDGIKFDPMDVDLDYFVLENLNIRGDIYRITYRKEGCNMPEASYIPYGYNVFKNGVKIVTILKI